MVNIYRLRRTHLKTSYLLRLNLRALLSRRGKDAAIAAEWAGHKGPWLSKILSGDRGIKLDDLDRLADHFGLTTAQLISPGISALTERRRGERRSGRERRSGTDRRGDRPETRLSYISSHLVREPE